MPAVGKLKFQLSESETEPVEMEVPLPTPGSVSTKYSAAMIEGTIVKARPSLSDQIPSEVHVRMYSI
jgi:hypothetical protein